MYQKSAIRHCLVLLSIVLVAIGSVGMAFAQQGNVTVTGTVFDDKGTAVAGAQVSLAVGSLAVLSTTTSDANGNFSVSAFSPGTYVLHVRKDPLPEALMEFAVGPGRTLGPLRVTLPPAGGAAPAAPTQGPYTPQPAATPTASPATTSGTTSNNTNSAEIVPSLGLMDAQQAARPGDVLQNISGILPAFGYGLYRDRVLIRGFESALFAQGAATIDGFPQADAAHSMANIERMEVKKEAAALLSGRADAVGLVNYVTRRPQSQWAHSLEQQLGTFGSVRTLLDSTGPVRSDGSLLYRANLEYAGAESFRDSVTWRRLFAAPSLTWRISGRTQLGIDGRYQHDKTPPDYGIPAAGGEAAEIPASRYLGEPGDLAVTKIDQEGVSLTHEIDEDWKIRTSASRYSSRGDRNETVIQTLNEITGIADRFLYKAPSGTKSFQFGGETTGTADTDYILHTLTAGANHYRRNFFEKTVFVNAASTTTGLFPTQININNPVYEGFDKEEVLSNQPLLPFQSNESWWGAYLQDQMSLGKGLRVMLGARLDHVSWDQSHSEDGFVDIRSVETEFSPRAGVLYQPASFISFFANHTYAFGGPNISVNTAGGALPSRFSRQSEGGIRTRWLQDRISASAVYFHVIHENIAQPLTPFPGGASELTGEARNHGVEVDLTGRVLRYVDVVANYTHADSEFTEDVLLEGKSLPNVAKHTGRLWAQSRLDWTGVTGFAVGGGVSVVTKRYGDIGNTFVMGQYERVDMAVSYAARLSRTLLTIRANVSNLLDQERQFLAADWRPTFARRAITPGAPRVVMVGFRVEF